MNLKPVADDVYQLPLMPRSGIERVSRDPAKLASFARNH